MADTKKEFGISKALNQTLSSMFASNPIIRTKIVNKNITAQGTAMRVLKDVSTFYLTMMANQSYDRFARYGDYCIAGDTKIATPEFECGYATIEELVEKYPNGERFLVYGYNKETDKIELTYAHHPRFVKEDYVIDVVLDNGQQISTTPDHKFLTKQGEYIEAQNLNIKMQIMSNDLVFVKDIVKNNQIKRVFNLTTDLGNFGVFYTSVSAQHIEFITILKNCEMESCLVGETKIPTPETESGYITLEELSKLDREFLIYSYDFNKKEIGLAYGHNCRKTKTGECYKVTFDNGSELIGSPDHKILLSSGKFKEIQDLQINDSVMPFYEKYFGNYRCVWTASNRTRSGLVSEHRLVAEFAADRKLEEGEVVHHKDFNKRNNNIENLQIMTDHEHKNYHAIVINEKKWQDEEFRKRFSENHSKFMRENNPAERTDVKFSYILQLAEKWDFDKKRIMEFFNCSHTAINTEIKRNGYKNWKVFAKAYKPNWIPRGQITDSNGKNNKHYDHNFTFEDIARAYQGQSLTSLSKDLNKCKQTILSRIKEVGFTDWQDFKDRHTNHKVKSVEYYGVRDLYDFTVDGRKNYATEHVVVHNTPELSAALNIYADECTTLDEQGVMVSIKTDDKKIKDILSDFFVSVLNINSNLWHWTRNMCKYGDYFMLNNIVEGQGITNTLMMPVNEVLREEGFNKDNPFAVRYRWQTRGNQDIEPFEISHFRLTGRENFLPYGSSILEPARRIWRQLILLEDSMLVYRIVRAPERRVFSVEVGNASAEEIPLIVEKFRSNVVEQNIIDGQGRVEQRFNPMDMATDYYIPTRGGQGSKIENLPGGAFNGDIDDVEYIQRKLIAALHIPKAFLSFDESLCISHDTKVFTLERGYLTPTEISLRVSSGEYLSTAVCSEEKETRFQKIIWCGPTKYVDKIYKITLSNGKEFKCTDTHPIMMSDGSYKEAKDIIINDECMAFGYVEENQKYIYDNNSELWGAIDSECKKNYSNEKLSVKISNIEIVEHNDWVWDLHIPEYHNFAIEAGIFIHNSGKATLAQEDIRWARTVQRVQRALVGELTRLAMIHLVAKGITNEDDLCNFELSLNNPSNLSILQRMEVWSKKLEVSRAALDSGLPNQWVQEQLFGFTKDQFEANKRWRLEDASFEALFDKIKAGENPEEQPAEEETFVKSEPPSLAGVGTEDLYAHTNLGKYEEETGLAYVMHDIIDPLTERQQRITNNKSILKELKESDSFSKLANKLIGKKSVLLEAKQIQQTKEMQFLLKEQQNKCGNGNCEPIENKNEKPFAKFLK